MIIGLLKHEKLALWFPLYRLWQKQPVHILSWSLEVCYFSQLMNAKVSSFQSNFNSNQDSMLMTK